MLAVENVSRSGLEKGKKSKYMKTKIIIICIFIVIVVVIGYKRFSKPEQVLYDFIITEKSDIVQTVSVTGQVIPVQKIDLQFEIPGRITTIKVQQGDQVETGDILVMLDRTELNTKVLEAEAARDVAQAKLDQLLAGARKQEIKVYETAKENAEIALQSAQIALENAKQSAADVQAIAQENLSQAYDDALDILNDAYVKAYNASNATVSIYRDYFQTSALIKDDKENIENAVSQIQVCRDQIKESPSNQNTDTALSNFTKYLSEINNNLENIRTTIEKPTYFYIVSDTDKTILDNQTSYVNTAITNIVGIQQTISSTKLTNESNINTAKFSLDAAQNQVYRIEGDLQSTQDQLAKIKAPPAQADLNLTQAQLSQAEAALTKTKQQRTKANLLAPISGTITDIKKEESEVIIAGEIIVSMIGLGEFQIEVDIPEVDISKVSIQDSAEIILDAFPEKRFLGRVIEIDTAETIIQGVVYYKVELSLESKNQEAKSGMTANVEIIAETKQNALSVPQRAIFSKNGQKFVRILQNEQVQEIEVETGIRGSQGEIEIMSGLNQGDKVITFINEKK